MNSQHDIYKMYFQSIDHENDCYTTFFTTDTTIYCINFYFYYRRFYGKTDWSFTGWVVDLPQDIEEFMARAKFNGPNNRIEITDNDKKSKVVDDMHHLLGIYFREIDILDGSVSVEINPDEPHSLTEDQFRELFYSEFESSQSDSEALEQ